MPPFDPRMMRRPMQGQPGIGPSVMPQQMMRPPMPPGQMGQAGPPPMNPQMGPPQTNQMQGPPPGPQGQVDPRVMQMMEARKQQMMQGPPQGMGPSPQAMGRGIGGAMRGMFGR